MVLITDIEATDEPGRAGNWPLIRSGMTLLVMCLAAIAVEILK